MGRASPADFPLVTGMISPSIPFVDPASGVLTSNSYRFLHDLLQPLSTAKGNVADLTTQQASLQSQQATMQQQQTAMQAQLAQFQAQLDQFALEIAAFVVLLGNLGNVTFGNSQLTAGTQAPRFMQINISANDPLGAGSYVLPLYRPS